MKVSRFAIHRPVFTTMVVLLVLILGGVALVRLPVDLMPDITYPTLTVRGSYENASPEEVEQLITEPIEEAVAAVPGVEEVTSASSEGTSSVRISFTWGTDLDTGASDIRDRLDRIIPQLPDEADRPTLFKFDLASFPVVILGAASDVDPLALSRLIEEQVQYRIERLPGVAALDVWGDRRREIHVDLDRDRCNALGISLAQVIERIRVANVTLPAGRIDRGTQEVSIRTPGTYERLEELRDTVVATRDGVPIQLREIAQVRDTWQRVRQVVRVNGRPGVRLAVRKQSGANTVQVAKVVLAEVEKLNRDLPQVRLVPILNTADYIERSIANVGTAAVLGGLLAVGVLLVFLRHLRSTAVIAIAIPISIVATFTLMFFTGYTLNLMSLGGLALGVGMLLDNSIVVLENIFRLHEAGEDPFAAAEKGTDEVATAILASTLTTVVVFLPLLFVPGMSGVMFKQLAVVVTFALLCSLWVALTVVPMLAARLLRRGERLALGEREHRVERAARLALEWVASRYAGLLGRALRRRFWVVSATVALLVACGLLARYIGTELMPATDEGEVRVDMEMAVGTRLAIVDATMARVEEICRREVPELESMVASIGGGGWRVSGVHTGEIRMALKPQRQRARASEQIAEALRKPLAGIPGTTIRTRAGQGLFMARMMGGGGERVEIDVRGHDFAKADALARQVRQIVADIPGVTDVRLSRDPGGPEEVILIDRDKAADMKVSVSQIAGMLQTVLSGTGAGNFREAGDEYRILVQFRDSETLTLDEILDLTLPNADGELVVLRNVVTVSPQTGPVSIDRRDQERVVTVRANISGRDLGSIMADARERLAEVPVPRDFAIVFSGDYEEQQKSFRELLFSFVLALVLVYVVMACQYESLRDPLVVMFSVPVAAVGVVLTLFFTRTTFNIQSFIGCIMLGGIVVNNAILLVDHTNLLRRRDGMALDAAIAEAGRRRLRPILMTALTTVLGLLPLALALAEGGEAQAPLARAVIGGLASSSLITLVLVPVIYSLFEHGRRPAALS